MKYFVLHNRYDRSSRDFTGTIPKDNNEYVIIDWYEDEGARFSYLGPPASAFPSVAFESENEFFIIRAPESWEEVDEAVGASLARTKHSKLSSSEKDEFIGGQRVEELSSLVKSYPQYFKDSRSVEAKIEVVKERKNGEEVKKLDQAPDLRSPKG